MLTIAALMVASGCTGRASAPLDVRPIDTRVCIPRPEDGRITFAVDATQFTGNASVRITGVELKNPKHLKIVGARVHVTSESSTEDLVGLLNGWPPRHPSRLGPEVSRLPQALGYRLTSKPGRVVSFVAGIEATSAGHSGPLQVHYVDDRGQTFTWTGATTLVVAEGSCKTF